MKTAQRVSNKIEEFGLSSRTLIYGGNVLVGTIGNYANFPIAHPYSAAFYGGLGILERFLGKSINNRVVRIVKVGGSLAFGLVSIINGISIMTGNGSFVDSIKGKPGSEAGELLNIPFDLSMAYRTITDAIENYKDIRQDSLLKGVIEDVSLLGKKIIPSP